jgi:putative acyl-CoA dehydrogenase
VPLVRPGTARQGGGGVHAVADTGGEVLDLQERAGLFYEAMECLGGNGYVEEGILARHYRESPVNAIWKARAMSCASTCCVLSREADAAADVLRGLVEQTRDCPASPKPLASSQNRFVSLTPSGLRGLRWRSWRWSRLRLRLMKYRRNMRNFAATRLAADHGNLYGAVDLADQDIRGLLDRALPV